MIEGIKDHFVLYSHSSDYSLFTWNFLKAIKFSSHRQLSNCYMSEISLSALFSQLVIFLSGAPKIASVIQTLASFVHLFKMYLAGSSFKFL